MNIFDAKLFSNFEQRLVTEVSDLSAYLRDGAAVFEPLNELFEGHVGLAVRLDNDTIVFYVDGVERCDGDLVSWSLRPIPSEPAPARALRMTIYND